MPILLTFSYSTNESKRTQRDLTMPRLGQGEIGDELESAMNCFVSSLRFELTKQAKWMKMEMLKIEKGR